MFCCSLTLGGGFYGGLGENAVNNGGEESPHSPITTSVQGALPHSSAIPICLAPSSIAIPKHAPNSKKQQKPANFQKRIFMTNNLDKEKTNYIFQKSNKRFLNKLKKIFH
jgi:hypothetical protein